MRDDEIQGSLTRILYCCLPSIKEELTTISLIVSLLCLFAQCHYLNDIGITPPVFEFVLQD